MSWPQSNIQGASCFLPLAQLCRVSRVKLTGTACLRRLASLLNSAADGSLFHCSYTNSSALVWMHLINTHCSSYCMFCKSTLLSWVFHLNLRSHPEGPGQSVSLPNNVHIYRRYMSSLEAAFQDLLVTSALTNIIRKNQEATKNNQSKTKILKLKSWKVMQYVWICFLALYMCSPGFKGLPGRVWNW